MVDEFGLLKNVFGVEETPAEEPTASPAPTFKEPEKAIERGAAPLERSASYLEYANRIIAESAEAMRIPSHLLDNRIDAKLEVVGSGGSWKLVLTLRGNQFVLAAGNEISYRLRSVEDFAGRGPFLGDSCDMVCELGNASLNAHAFSSLAGQLDLLKRANNSAASAAAD
jgi:hypothetical protein